MESIKDKYCNKPSFRYLTDILESFLLEKRLIVPDLFSAVLAASMRYNQIKINEILDIDRDDLCAAITYGMVFVKDGKIIPLLEIYKEKEDKNEAD